jgi:hypothetical protein
VNIDVLLTTCVGFEDDGRQIRFFLDSPTPGVSLTRERGVRTPLFHLCAGDDADAVREYLARHRCWDVMRVPPAFTPERGAAALRIAGRWHSGRHSPLYLFADSRRIRDEEHRDQLRRATEYMIASVLENPVRDHEYEYADLTLLREVIDTAPLATELCPAAEVVWCEQTETHEERR